MEAIFQLAGCLIFFMKVHFHRWTVEHRDYPQHQTRYWLGQFSSFLTLLRRFCLRRKWSLAWFFPFPNNTLVGSSTFWHPFAFLHSSFPPSFSKILTFFQNLPCFHTSLLCFPPECSSSYPGWPPILIVQQPCFWWSAASCFSPLSSTHFRLLILILSIFAYLNFIFFLCCLHVFSWAQTTGT